MEPVTRRHRYVPRRRSVNPWTGIGWIILAGMLLAFGVLGVIGLGVLVLLGQAG